LKSVFMILIVAVIALSILLSGCLSLPGPSTPVISFNPAQPVAGQPVQIIVQSNDTYSNLTCALSVDGQPISVYGTNDVFTGNWNASAGIHTFDATVTDSYNHSSFTSKILNVGLPNPPAISNILWVPVDPQGGNVMQFSFCATSVIGITSANAFIDSSPLFMVKNGNTFSATWNAIPGDHTLKITASNSIETASTSISFQVAAYPYPKINSVSWTPLYPTSNDPSVTFTINGYDPIGFIPSIYVDGTPLKTTSLSSETSIATWSVIPGYHEVDVLLTDQVGWYNEQTYHIAVTPQIENMFIILGITPQQVEHGNPVTISAVTYNYYPPMQKMSLYVDNSLMDTVSGTDTLKYTFTPSDGTHQIMVMAQDSVGMEASAVGIFNVQYNPNAYPPVLIPSFTPQATFGSTKILKVYAKATAPDAIISNVTFENMISSTQIGDISVGNNGIYATSWTPNEIGNIPILVKATDSNGIQSATVVNVKVSPDYINGNGPVIYPVFTSMIEQSSLITLGASIISNAKLADVDMWIDDVPITPSKSSTGLYSVQWIASATGTHLFKVYAQDILGRAATSDFYFYVYPGALPQMQIQATPSSVYLGGMISFDATVIKSPSAISLVNFYVDDINVGSSYYPPYRLAWKTQSAGSHTLTVEAVNVYGQKGYASTYFNVFKDTTPPELTLTAPSTASTSQNITITAEASDPISGISDLQLQIYSSNAPEPYPNIIPVLSQTFNTDHFTFNWVPYQSATYTVYVVAVDNAGNSTKKSSKIIVMLDKL